MIKKLCSYCLNCVIEAQKSENFISLKKCKDFAKESETKKIKELKTIQKLNSSTMILYYCSKYFISDFPLFYKENEEQKNYILNVGIILKYFNDFDYLEMFLNEIKDLKEEEEIIEILKNYIDVEIENKKENYIILSYIQEAKAGIIKELKQIINNC